MFPDANVMTAFLEKIYDKFRYSPLNDITFGMRVAAHRWHMPLWH